MAGGAQGASGSNFPQGGGQKANNPQFSMPTFGGYGGVTGGQMPQAQAPQPFSILPAYGGPAPASQLPAQYQPPPQMAKPAVMPQGPMSGQAMVPMYNQAIQDAQQGMTGRIPAPQDQVANNPQSSMPLPQDMQLGMAKPAVMPQDARFQQNPGMTPRVLDFMQRQGTGQFVQGNPNSMPVQRMTRRDMMGSR